MTLAVVTFVFAACICALSGLFLMQTRRLWELEAKVRRMQAVVFTSKPSRDFGGVCTKLLEMSSPSSSSQARRTDLETRLGGEA